MDGEKAIAYLRNEPPYDDKEQFSTPDIFF